MEILTTWHGEQFNIELASKEGAEPFLSVKGCRIVDGSKGAFVSFPATKNATTGKWWQHAWGSERFNAAVLEKALASRPSPTRSPRGQAASQDEDIPF